MGTEFVPPVGLEERSLRKFLHLCVIWVVAVSCSEVSPEGNSADSEVHSLSDLHTLDANTSTSLHLSSGQVKYTFLWKDVPDEWSEAGVITNELGYSLEIERAWLGVNRIQLIPCKIDEQQGWFKNFSIVASAFAGHDDGPPDPSAFDVGLVEEIGSALATETPIIQVETGLYCGVHVLYAETPEFAVDAEDEMVGLTLLLRGHWWSPWSDTKTPFELSTTLGNGAIYDFEEDLNRNLDITREGVEVKVERSFETLFNGMDLEVMSDKALSKVFLTNLVANTKIQTLISAQ